MTVQVRPQPNRNTEVGDVFIDVTGGDPFLVTDKRSGYYSVINLRSPLALGQIDHSGNQGRYKNVGPILSLVTERD